jgi:hypothetical protein
MWKTRPKEKSGTIVIFLGVGKIRKILKEIYWWEL